MMQLQVHLSGTVRRALAPPTRWQLRELVIGRGRTKWHRLETNLRQAREARKMTLQEIAATTKVSTRALQALEDERFDLLPGGIFNKGFVRAYARCVGLDEEKSVAEYLEAAKLATPEIDMQMMSSQVSEASAAAREPGVERGNRGGRAGLDRRAWDGRGVAERTAQGFPRTGGSAARGSKYRSEHDASNFNSGSAAGSRERAQQRKPGSGARAECSAERRPERTPERECAAERKSEFQCGREAGWVGGSRGSGRGFDLRHDTVMDQRAQRW